MIYTTKEIEDMIGDAFNAGQNYQQYAEGLQNKVELNQEDYIRSLSLWNIEQKTSLIAEVRIYLERTPASSEPKYTCIKECGILIKNHNIKQRV